METAPTVGIVIPNFNGARFLSDALTSALGQRRPPDEVLVMDGGSDDGSLELLHQFGERVRVVSERDRGQADAIAKGFGRLSTDLVGWLNSDDRLMPDAVSRVVEAASRDPGAVLFHGDAEQIDEWGRLVGHIRSLDLDYERLRSQRGRVVQPGSFYRRTAVEGGGGVRRDYHLLMDLDLWIRLLRQGRAVRLPGPLAQFRIHGAAKSSQPPWRYYRESIRIGWEHEGDRPILALGRRLWGAARHLAAFSLGLSRDRVRPVRPPSDRPTVRAFGEIPAMLAKLKARGVVRLVDRDGTIEVHDLNSLRRRRAGRSWGRSLVFADARRDMGRFAGLADHPIACALVKADSRGAVEGEGLPPCRVADVDREEDWLRAISLAAGAWPGARHG